MGVYIHGNCRGEVFILSSSYFSHLLDPSNCAYYTLISTFILPHLIHRKHLSQIPTKRTRVDYQLLDRS